MRTQRQRQRGRKEKERELDSNPLVTFRIDANTHTITHTHTHTHTYAHTTNLSHTDRHAHPLSLLSFPEATCYVGGLDDRITEELLWELFLQAGPVGASASAAPDPCAYARTTLQC